MDFQAIELVSRILEQDPGPVIRFRLLRDVIGLDNNSSEYHQAKKSLAQSALVRQLQPSQWLDGSWGRLHSQDTQAKQIIPTTEFGVERAIAIGMDSKHPVLRRANDYLISLLNGKIRCRDRLEKNDRWETGVRLFTAASLALISPNLPLLDQEWNLWLEIAQRTFQNRVYDPQAEIQIHRKLTGAAVKDSYLRLNNKYTLTLLSSRPTALPVELEQSLVGWIWKSSTGIIYLNEPLWQLPDPVNRGKFEHWLASLELLAHFPSFRKFARQALNWLWNLRLSDDCWDFGSRSRSSVCLPLSENPRKKQAQKFDWTTRLLLLFTKADFLQDGQTSPI